MPIQIHGQSDFLKNKTKQNKTNTKTNKKPHLSCFHGSHFLCVGKGRVVVIVVCVGGSAGVLMRFVWRSLFLGRGVWGVGCVFWGCGLVSEFGQVA